MELVKNMISSEIERINESIKINENKNESIKLKNELLEVLFLINMSEKYHISKNEIKNIFKIPKENTGHSEYRIINDCESDNPLNWREVMINNENMRLQENDIIIKLK
ncbi:hypothetical protein [Chryseobacterium sp. ERMR1:04]|uniref:hypothetical protein n=1 Tax=Chryseobacterium sp. ERMR1:04 TaxID=1705393 RepID=UPI0006C831D0|nr:hypothetical protein [Chryseobacterium sp. ERMR1:04]KPH14710.1 hypothetical protein AMQ68_04475 [Chryseobacterium sp. ERMR1:04]